MKKALLSGLMLTAIFSILVAPVMVSAQADTLSNKIDKIAGVIRTIVVSIAVLFIIIAAFYFITAAGDPEKIKTARNFVLYAVIGVVVAVLAEFLVGWAETFA